MIKWRVILGKAPPVHHLSISDEKWLDFSPAYDFFSLKVSKHRFHSVWFYILIRHHIAVHHIGFEANYSQKVNRYRFYSVQSFCWTIISRSVSLFVSQSVFPQKGNKYRFHSLFDFHVSAYQMSALIRRLHLSDVCTYPLRTYITFLYITFDSKLIIP